MPYFKNNNVLFIHIPKTGGTSVENYFYKKFGIKRTLETLFGTLSNTLNNHSLQHCTYRELYENRIKFDINFQNLKIISIVRNPYDRIVSDLFYFKLIDTKMTPDQIFENIKLFLNSDNFNYDDHKKEQYKYLIDENNNIQEHLIILKTENLCQDMKSIGYRDFNYEDNKTYRNKINYLNLLNNDSIKIINDYYKKDFVYFNYESIATNK